MYIEIVENVYSHEMTITIIMKNKNHIYIQYLLVNI